MRFGWAYLVESSAVVVQGEDLVRRLSRALIDTGDSVFVLVDIVAEMDLESEHGASVRVEQTHHVVHVVLAHNIAIRVEVSVGWDSQLLLIKKSLGCIR